MRGMQHIDFRDRYWAQWANSHLPLGPFEDWLAGFAGKPKARPCARKATKAHGRAPSELSYEIPGSTAANLAHPLTQEGLNR